MYDGRMEGAIVVPAGITVSATNSGGTSPVPMLAGTYSGPTALLAMMVAQLNATRLPATWSGSVSVGASGTGKASINWTGAGTYSITWTSTVLRDALGYTANLAAVTQGVASVAPKQVRALWFPDCPLNLDGDPRSAPRRSDRRASSDPSGNVYTHVGNTFYQLRNLRYSHVPIGRVWEANAATPNASWETFYGDTQLGIGLAWCKPGSRVIIYDHTGALVGSNGSVSGWYLTNPTELDALTLSVDQWTGLYLIPIGNITSAG